VRHFVALVQARLGRPVTSLIARDYDHLLEGVATAGIDLAWMPPLVHARSDGLLAAVMQRGGAVTYRAALLVRADSKLAAVSDLRQARAAWSDHASASGHIFPRLHLEASSVTPASEDFLGSFAAAMAAVIDDRADVCACFIRNDAGEHALDDVARSFPQAAWRLRVLDVTESIPPDGLVLAPNIEGALQARIRDLLLALHEQPDGEAILRELFGCERLVPVTPQVARTIERVRALTRKHL
jgi:ABC-type phosphate/phosphonate transport system substrate-binding protein